MKSEWTWNNTYQKLYEKAQLFIKKDAFMTFYNEKEHLYLETDISGVSLGASLLQVGNRMQFQKVTHPIQHCD